MKKVITFGEIMMRLNPEGYLRLLQAQKLEMSFAGGEANVAVSVANFGMKAAFVTKLPDNVLAGGQRWSCRSMASTQKRSYTAENVWGFTLWKREPPQRPSKVLYDRGASAIALAERTDFDWEHILEGANWFHFTGITPALSEGCAEICEDALRVCKEKHITVSCDLNFRKKLWSKEKAGEVMGRLMKYVDVCIANEADAADVFGICAGNSDISKGELDRQGYVSVAQQLVERFGIKSVAITLRKKYFRQHQSLGRAALYRRRGILFARVYDTDRRPGRRRRFLCGSADLCVKQRL